jgi:hypothetical protein
MPRPQRKKRFPPSSSDNKDIIGVNGGIGNQVVESDTIGQKALNLLFPGRKAISEYDARNVDLPAQTAGYFGDYGDQVVDPVQHVFAMTTDEDKLIHQLPVDRVSKYGFLDAMALDPTIESAVQMHIAHALSADLNSGQIIKIESSTDAENEFVKELKETFESDFNEKIRTWAFPAAIYGVNYLRVYSEPGVGVTHIRDDFYTHPRHLREYEHSGRLAGFTSAYQGTQKTVTLMPPWSFVSVKIPYNRKDYVVEPYRVDAKNVDISNDDYSQESMVETQNYGTSLIETAYGPWFDLMEAILSLNMSRKNAARLERLIGVNMGRLDPVRSAKYLNAITSQMKKADKEMARRSLRKGFVQTVLNHIIPIWGDSKGRLDINSLQGTPDINGLEDVFFHVKRLGSALGIDPSLLGFGDMMQGGLGEGGWFRVSVIAAMKAQQLRSAIRTTCDRIMDIHVAQKTGKIFLPGQKPWKIVFNSVSTAMEREERENMEGRANLVSLIVGSVAGMDQEFSHMKRSAFYNYLFTDILKMDEQKFKEAFPEALVDKPPEQPKDEDGGNGGGGGGNPFESLDEEKIKTMVFEAIGNFYEKTEV